MSVLIAAKPGPLRDSLEVILLSMPQIEVVCLTGDISSAKKMIATGHPALVLLDGGLIGDEITNLVGMIKVEPNPSRCLILADDVRQQQEALSAGADRVLLKGFPAAKLLQVAEQLLSENTAPTYRGGACVQSIRG